MLTRPILLLALSGIFFLGHFAHAGIVTLGNGGTNNIANTSQTSLWIRIYTTANGAASYNLSSIQLKNVSALTESVSYSLYDSTGTSIVNNISGTRTMTNGFMDLSGGNSFAGGATSKTYVLQISGLTSSKYYQSNQRTNLPISNTNYFTKAYEQTSLIDNNVLANAQDSFAATLTISVPEPSTFLLMGLTMLAGIAFVIIKPYSLKKIHKQPV